MNVNLETAYPTIGLIVGDRDVVVEGCVIHKDVDRTVGGARGFQQLLAAFFFGDVAGDRGRLASSVLDALDGPGEGSFEHVFAFVQSARRADDPAALGGERLSDGLPDPAACPCYHHMLAVELAHLSHLRLVFRVRD